MENQFEIGDRVKFKEVDGGWIMSGVVVQVPELQVRDFYLVSTNTCGNQENFHVIKLKEYQIMTH